LGQNGFGTRYAYPQNGVLPDDEFGGDVKNLPVDLAMNASSLGAYVIECKTYEDFILGLKKAKETDKTTVIYIRNDRYVGVPNYESWWDVAIAEVSDMEGVRSAREEWSEMLKKERFFF